MANRRMFSRELTESDKFLEMPASTQALFFHLGMNADDEGYTSSPRKIMRMCGCREDDLAVLIAKNYIIPFDSGVVVIVDWTKHNQIRADRFKPSIHSNEKLHLESLMVTDLQPIGNQMHTSGCPSIVESSIVKSSKVEDSKVKDSIYTHVVEFWNDNTQNLPIPRKLTDKIERAINGITRDGLTFEDIQHSIVAYNHITNGEQYFFDYKWGLLDFLKREGGCRRFADVKDDKQYLKNSSSKSIIISEECPYL